MFLSKLHKKFVKANRPQQERKKRQTSVAAVSSGTASAATNEIIPWGVRAVWQGEDIRQKGNFASDTYAFVIDSGVLDTTGDLNFAPISWHRSWIAGQSPFTDVNGHGTHVAGTIGSLVNGQGIVGVAPGAQIVSLKVLNDQGFGDGTITAEAVRYAVSIINNNNLDKSKVVINISICGTYDQVLNDTIIDAANQGIRFSIAAGNRGKDIDLYSPGSTGIHPNVYTASAVDSNYYMQYWSNWDMLDATDTADSVDFAAPGVGVLSYYKNGQLTYLNGTSFASAHLAGLLLTGGVQAGYSVVPNVSGEADPFALTSTKVFSPPPPSYSLTAGPSVNEGQNVRIDISTAGVRPGTGLFWRMSGMGIIPDDFRQNGYLRFESLTGVAIVSFDGTSFVELYVFPDQLTEGVETLKFELFDSGDPVTQKKIGETLISIQDTSIAPPAPVEQYFYGTMGNDAITGVDVGFQNDWLCGVVQTGTTLEARGKGQIDTLTGNVGKDTFMLADKRGFFYDDGLPFNPGTTDYAIIKNFTPGEDKIQLRGVDWVFSSSGGNTSIYWDRNRNRILDITPPGVYASSDDLVAIVQGVNSISASDIVYPV